MNLELTKKLEKLEAEIAHIRAEIDRNTPTELPFLLKGG